MILDKGNSMKKLYKGANFLAKFCRIGKWPISFVRQGIPSVRYFCCRVSAFNLVISTPEGHSVWQPLQERQRSKISFNSGLVKGFSPGSDNICLSMLALARVLSFSSSVAMKLGHMVPPVKAVFLQSPEPEHFSASLSGFSKSP